MAVLSALAKGRGDQPSDRTGEGWVLLTQRMRWAWGGLEEPVLDSVGGVFRGTSLTAQTEVSMASIATLPCLLLCPVVGKPNTQWDGE